LFRIAIGSSNSSVSGIVSPSIGRRGCAAR
jgi:hypothetical protein